MTIPQKINLDLSLRAKPSTPKISMELLDTVKRAIYCGGKYPHKHDAALAQLEDIFQQTPDVLQAKVFTCEGTILHDIAFLGTADMAELAIHYGADIDAKDKYQKTPLHTTALEKNKDSIAVMLLQYKANIEAADHHGITPLVDAVYAGNKEMCDLLVICGADPDKATGYLGKSAMSHAEDIGKNDLADIMRRAKQRLQIAEQQQDMTQVAEPSPTIATTKPVQKFEKMKIRKP